jgi:hypothetical protein
MLKNFWCRNVLQNLGWRGVFEQYSVCLASMKPSSNLGIAEKNFTKFIFPPMVSILVKHK